MNVFQPGDHGSTFGGNPLAAAVGLEALNVIVEEDLSGNSARLGDYFINALKRLKLPMVLDVRGRGLFIGVEIDTARVTARQMAERLLVHGILSKDTHDSVLRFAPPLIITQAQIDDALIAIRAAFREADKGGADYRAAIGT